MERANVTGYCYLDGEWHKLRKGAAVFLTVAAFLLIGFALWVRRKIMLMPGVLILLTLVCLVIAKRYGCDPDAVFELSETGIQTTSVSKKMCRRFSWAEVSVIHITRIEGNGRAGVPAVECYLFVRGKENALTEGSTLDSFRYLMNPYRALVSNPNRIIIPRNAQTAPIVTAMAERYGIPTERQTGGRFSV